MKDKIKTSTITLIRVIKDENGESRGEAIFEEIKAMTFQGQTVKV